ncbi:hypothetical protein IFM89_002318 [Coptis chinensis]|uniref:Large ribosomal subunit protein uL29m n=1 Tax=Coptis chinensis TaxID=261450 RepID=A0A835M3U0_9MAGN|nr:hypothetical protein IFM89_002318 [Coptis chinensis]
MKMFLVNVFKRTLFSAARSEASNAASVSSAKSMYNPLEAFFEADRSQEEEKPVVYGRGWKASELRLKSWDDLQKLWYVLLKEKNMLMTQRQMLNTQNLRFPNPERIPKIRSTCDPDRNIGLQQGASTSKEVNVSNQACTNRESNRRTRFKEVCRDEEDDKCFMSWFSIYYQPSTLLTGLRVAKVLKVRIVLFIPGVVIFYVLLL